MKNIRCIQIFIVFFINKINTDATDTNLNPAGQSGNNTCATNCTNMSGIGCLSESASQQNCCEQNKAINQPVHHPKVMTETPTTDQCTSVQQPQAVATAPTTAPCTCYQQPQVYTLAPPVTVTDFAKWENPCDCTKTEKKEVKAVHVPSKYNGWAKRWKNDAKMPPFETTNLHDSQALRKCTYLKRKRANIAALVKNMKKSIKRKQKNSSTSSSSEEEVEDDFDLQECQSVLTGVKKMTGYNPYVDSDCGPPCHIVGNGVSEKAIHPTDEEKRLENEKLDSKSSETSEDSSPSNDSNIKINGKKLKLKDKLKGLSKKIGSGLKPKKRLKRLLKK